MFIRCFTPIFSETEFPPQDPQPKVRDGSSLKLYKSPIPPCEEGVFTSILQVFIAFSNMPNFSFSLSSIYMEDVCP